MAASIDALLPQTQCTKCGFDGCAPYAQAIASGDAQIDRCPPGGTAGIARLAQLLGREPLPLDASRGIEGPRRVAWIDPQSCIGCTKCIQACPVDAIIGAQRRMHTVVAALCTGCDLCVAPCPVDCIEMQPLPATALHGGTSPHWTDAEAAASRSRHLARRARLARERDRRNERLAGRGLAEHGPAEHDSDVRGLAEPGLPARGLAEREFPERGLAEREFPERGLAEREFAERGPAGRQPPDHDTAHHGAAEQARGTPGDDAARRKRAVIEAAMRRARERLAAVRHGGARR